MSLIVVGVSHRSAPLEMLEQVALDAEQANVLAGEVAGLEDVRESLVLTTCNRTEVYADALTFHGALAQVGAALAERTGVTVADLTPHLYVHFEDRAVHHLFSLACGLESMALGETEILGQLRTALADAQSGHHLGGALNPLFQQALRVGKRAHSETGLGQIGRSLVRVGIESAARRSSLTGTNAVVVGAGAMSGLATASLSRAGLGSLTVVNRTWERAERLAEANGATPRPWADLPEVLAEADLVLTCTGATGHIITPELIATLDRGERPLILIDLAMPRDVAPEVADLPEVTVWGLSELAEFADAGLAAASADSTATNEGNPTGTDTVIQSVRDLVTAEVGTFLATRRSAQVGPTLSTLRSRASGVADAELTRLDSRLPDLTDQQRTEVHTSVQRILDKLLHTPMVRARERAAEDTDGTYLAMLRELFDLDPRETAAVQTPPRVSGLP